MKLKSNISPASEWAVIAITMLIFATICFVCGYGLTKQPESLFWGVNPAAKITGSEWSGR